MPSTTLAIDPGIRGVGAALFADGTLTKCAYIANPSLEGNGPLECVSMAYQVLGYFETLVIALAKSFIFYSLKDLGQLIPSRDS